MIALAIAALLASAPPTANDGVVLTGLLATAATDVSGVDVLTPADLRAALSLEGERQIIGCGATESCLAEIAAALDARAILYGTLGTLGDELVVQLNLFDSQRATSAGRASVRGKDISAIAGPAEAKTKELVRAFFTKNGGQSVKLLVLDLEVIGVTSAPTASADKPTTADADAELPWLTIGGASAAGLGVIGVVVGAIFDAAAITSATRAAEPSLSVKDARAAYAESDSNATAAIVSYAAGAVLVVGGLALVVVDVMQE